jgi:hypothetical protein
MKRIPHFKTLEDAREFWDTHSAAEYLGDMKPAPLKGARKPRKRTIAIRLTLTAQELQTFQDILAQLAQAHRAPAHR